MTKDEITKLSYQGVLSAIVKAFENEDKTMLTFCIDSLKSRVKTQGSLDHDWIEAPGGRMPCDRDTVVAVRLRNNHVSGYERARHYNWTLLPTDSNYITHYRIQ